MKFGIRLRELRKSLKTGIKALAKQVKVDHSYLSRIESGQVRPSEQIIRKLARALNHDEAELMILADRIPPGWRPAIKRAPQEATSFFRESLEDYKADVAAIENPAPTHPDANGVTVLPGKSKRKSPSGVATNDLVFSAQIGTNDELFPHILSLYVAPGSKIADATYGKGIFWKSVPKGTYRLLATDALEGVDCRSLPYGSDSIDCVVLDPPYMHTPGGTAHVGHQNYEGYYRNNSTTNGSGRKYHEAVLDLYFAAGIEAHRVLRNQGIFVVKCADEVCANQQRLTHVELINEYCGGGFVVEDIFVLVRRNRPGVSRMLKQMHARKNHSYFLVFRKSNGRTRWMGPENSSAHRQVCGLVKKLGKIHN
ncbi:MAG: helix-turn-helix domain-containing protein [Elusimicrobia bacterium]|nr:helix-turn-helix domain-containing protein [Elusimicrobiota bacterium]